MSRDGDRLAEALRTLGLREDQLDRGVVESLREAMSRSDPLSCLDESLDRTFGRPGPVEGRLVESFRGMGLSEEAARLAARGREAVGSGLSRLDESLDRVFGPPGGESGWVPLTESPPYRRYQQLQSEGMSPAAAADRAVVEDRGLVSLSATVPLSESTASPSRVPLAESCGCGVVHTAESCPKCRRPRAGR